jgi:hypothetical protein
MIPSVTMNSTMPRDRWAFPRVTSIEGGVSANLGTYRAGSYTATPQQVADFLTKSIFPPAMGPQDELPPFVKTLQSGVGTVGQISEPPVRFLSSRYQQPLGSGMTGRRSPADGIDPLNSVQPPPQVPGGLLGLLLDHLRNN